MKRVWTLSVMTAMAAGCLPMLAVAQSGDCLDPTAGLGMPVEAAIAMPTKSSACRGPTYDSSLGPIVNYGKPAAPVVTAPALGSGEGVDLDDLEAGTAPVISDYNTRELERLGELDAMQGRPVNMDRANDIDYLKGYTRGSERRMMPRPWR